VGWLDFRVSGPTTGQPVISVPGRASPRAGEGGAVQARARVAGRASPGMVWTGPCRAWAGPKLSCLGQAYGLRAAWPSIITRQKVTFKRKNVIYADFENVAAL